MPRVSREFSWSYCGPVFEALTLILAFFAIQRSTHVVKVHGPRQTS